GEGMMPGAWQFAGGWGDGRMRYPRVPVQATMRLYRPVGASNFSVRACGQPGDELRTFIEGTELPKLQFSDAGCHGYSAPAPGAGGGMQAVVFFTWPPEGDVRFSEAGFSGQPNP